MRALILEDQNYTAALSMVRSLGARGHATTVAAPFDTPAGLSRWCAEAVLAPWAADRLRYADFIASLLGKRTYDVAFACTDTVVEVVSRLRDQLPARPDFLLPPAYSLQTALSKHASQQFAAGLGVPTPRTIAPSPDEVDAAGREIGFPLVVKGDNGSGGSHVRYATNLDDLRRAYQETAAKKHLGRPILQEFVPGKGYLTHVLYHRGKPLAVCSHLKEREFPPTGGITAQGITVNEPTLDAQVLEIFSALRWHGLAKADFKRDARDGSFKLMELDPRVSASIEIPRAAGVDMVEMCCRLAAGNAVRTQLTYAQGVRVRYLCRDLLCLAAQPALLPRFLVDTVDRRVRSNFDWRDPRGTLGLLWRAKWAFEDAWSQGQITGEAQTSPVRRPPSRLKCQAHRALLAPTVGALREVGALYRLGAWRRPPAPQTGSTREPLEVLGAATGGGKLA